jgi:hypothetical protein
MGTVDLQEQYRDSTTDELRAIASSNKYSLDAQETARRILLERGVELPAAPPPALDAPAPPAPGPRRRPIWMWIPVLLFLGKKGCDKLLSYQEERHQGVPREGTFPTLYDDVKDTQKRLAEASSPIAAAARRPSVAPTHEIPWTPRTGPLDAREEALVGTWIARVGSGATRSAFMADNVALRTEGGDTADIAVALLKNDRLNTGCIWLELHEDRHGFRRECAIANDEPTAMSKVDPITGKQSDLGTAFEWAWDKKAKATRIHFDADMAMPAPDGKASLRFRTWLLRFSGGTADDAKMKVKVKESIPEHDLVRQEEDTYEVSPDRFLAGARDTPTGGAPAPPAPPSRGQ